MKYYEAKNKSLESCYPSPRTQTITRPRSNILFLGDEQQEQFLAHEPLVIIQNHNREFDRPNQLLTMDFALSTTCELHLFVSNSRRNPKLFFGEQKPHSLKIYPTSNGLLASGARLRKQDLTKAPVYQTDTETFEFEWRLKVNPCLSISSRHRRRQTRLSKSNFPQIMKRHSSRHTFGRENFLPSVLVGRPHRRGSCSFRRLPRQSFVSMMPK